MINYFNYPEKKNWHEILQRPAQDLSKLEAIVLEVFNAIKTERDRAVFNYTKKFDGVELEDMRVTDEELKEAEKLVDDDLKNAMQVAKANIEKFHVSQKEEVKIIETVGGVKCWRKNLPIEKVGLYIPGGTSPLFSTVLMLGIPAKIANCSEIVLCSPPNKDGKIHPAILYASQLIGITKIFKIGGIQAIGAMAYGTETVPKVFKIFGPGNQYVTAAKQLVYKTGTAIDLPAGPSELLIVGDNTANPGFIAADLLSQAEHGADSQVIFVTWEKELILKVQKKVEQQLKELPRKEIAQKALDNSKFILVKNKEDAIALTNEYAPEHLILAVEDEDFFTDKVQNAGSVFIGNYTPESAGDYASGTNHTLPTNGFAKAYSGVSVESFMKKITFQKITSEGLQTIGPIIEKMAEAEELEAHRRAISIRTRSSFEEI